MFILSFFTFLYGFVCIFTILLILIQRGKGNMGLGNLGGGNQAIFGSSGGQDIFQKITWMCLTLILAGSLTLALLRDKQSITQRSRYTSSMPMQDFPSDF
jgi:protein translocase SecG subunit